MRTITTLEGNTQKLDGGAMFGNAPKALWQRWVKADELNRIDLGCRAMLVQDGERTILIETGVGAFFSPEMRDRYGVQEERHVLLDELAARPVDADSSARASVAVAEAKILTTEAALNASEQLFALAGSSSTRAAHNLDRHWRNARVHTLHDPVRWKYHLLGNYLLNGIAPSYHQWN